MIYLLKSSGYEESESGEIKYFLLLKIGYTDDKNFKKRSESYRCHNITGKIIYTIPNAIEDHEKKLHYKFKDLKYDGHEWFKYDQSIIDYIKSVTLEELDELPYPFTSRIKSGLAKEIVSKVITVDNILDKYSVVDDYVKVMINKLGKSIMEESNIIKYLENDPTIDKRNIELYKNIKNRDKVVYSLDEGINREVSLFFNKYDQLTTIKDKLKLLCEGNLSKPAIELMLAQIPDSDEIKSYYISLGPDRLKSLSYNTHKIKKELGIVTFSIELLINGIYRNFDVGTRYTLNFIKEKLTNIYSSISYDKNPKATDLLEFYTVKECIIIENVGGKKKRMRGYELTGSYEQSFWDKLKEMKKLD